MIVRNLTKSTIYAEDIDFYIPYDENDREIKLSPDMLKRSRALKSAIISGMLDVVSYNDDEQIEIALIYLRNKKLNELKNENKSKEEIEDNHQIEIVEIPQLSQGNNIDVKINGLMYDDSGYAKVNRNLVFKLIQAGCRVKINPKSGKSKLTAEELQELVPLEKTQLSKKYINIDSSIPIFGENVGGKYQILYTTIESYTVPKQLVDCCELYQEVWVTSPFAQLILKKYINKPIYVIPAGVDELLYREDGPAFVFKPNVKDFVFISVFGWSYRKGYDVLLKSYFDEFSSDDNVTLLIMSKYQGNTSRFHKNKIKEDIEKIMREFPNKNLPHLLRHCQIVAEKDMPKMYRAANCFIICSRGEGSCTVPETQIVTSNGLKSIDSICEGDLVLTHNGNFKQVTQTTYRYIDEDIYEIFSSMNCDSIKLTKEHPVLILHKEKCYKHGKRILQNFIIENCEWTKPDEISIGDFVAFPLNFVKNNGLNTLKLTNYLNKDNTIEENDLLYRKIKNHFGSDRQSKHGNCVAVPNNINITQELLRFLGLYIAEGWSGYSHQKNSKGSVYFSFHKKEVEYISFVKNIIKNIFNSKSSCSNYQRDSHENRFTIVTHNTLLAELLHKLCGTGSHNKHLPDFVWQLSKEQIKSLLQGIFEGDGSFYANLSSPSLSLSTASKTLSEEVMLILRSIGISPCRQYKKERGYLISIKGEQLNDLKIKECVYPKNKKKNNVSQKTDKIVFLPVKKIIKQNYLGRVHNLEIDQDNTYATNNFIVHNCLPPVEASLCGLPVIMTNVSGQQMYLRPDNAYLIEPDQIVKMSSGKLHIHYWDNQEFPDLTSKSVIDQVKSTMRSVINDYEEAKRRNRKMQQLILSNFTWTHTANAALERLKAIKKQLGD